MKKLFSKENITTFAFVFIACATAILMVRKFGKYVPYFGTPPATTTPAA